MRCLRELRPLTRPRLALLVIVAAVVLLCISLWVNEGPLWRWVMTKRIPANGIFSDDFFDGPHPVRGWYIGKRWTDLRIRYRKEVWFYSENGYKAWERHFEGGRYVGKTWWRFDGTVIQQFGSPWCKKEVPPWSWNVTDQNVPTDPQWLAEHRDD